MWLEIYIIYSTLYYRWWCKNSLRSFICRQTTSYFIVYCDPLLDVPCLYVLCSEAYTIYFEQENLADESVLLVLCQCFKLFYAAGYHPKGLHHGILRWRCWNCRLWTGLYTVISFTIEHFEEIYLMRKFPVFSHSQLNNHLLHCALSLAAQCVVIGPVCGGRAVGREACVCLWVCYHDNSKLRASIFTKLSLKVKVVTISSWLNFGHPAPPGRGLQRGEIFWLHLTTASVQCLHLSESFFILWCFWVALWHKTIASWTRGM